MWFEGIDEYNEIVYGKTKEESSKEALEYYETIKEIKQNGSWWQKFRLWCILGNEEYNRY